MIEPHDQHPHQHQLKRPPLIICLAFMAYIITKRLWAKFRLGAECFALNLNNKLRILLLPKNTCEYLTHNCMECWSHKIVGDPHPIDRRRGKDKAVLCCRLMPTVPVNPNRAHPPKMRFNRRIVSCACSGLVQLRKESMVPEWCPKEVKQ